MFTKYLVDQKHSKTLILKNANRTVTIAVTTASPAVVACHRGCVLPMAVVRVMSHIL